MKALCKLEAGPGLTLTRTRKPVLGHNDVMIRIRKTAICGTDVHIWNWDAGHSRRSRCRCTWATNMSARSSRSVRRCGASRLATGSRARVISPAASAATAVPGGATCVAIQSASASTGRAFAEYLVIPAFNAFKIPEDVSDDLAAIFDPFGNATHTALSFNLVGEDVLITGAGPIGVMAVAIARHVGARSVVITDVNDYRLGLAKQMGATRTVNVERQSLKEVMEDLHMLEGFDVGLEMSGVPSAFTSMLAHMNHGGKIALLGIPPDNTAIDWNQVIFKGLQIKGIYGREMFETWYKMVAMLQSGLDLSPVITHHFPVAEYEAGFAAMLSGQSGKVILDWMQG
ncbi:L-threonine 3-dehydrogenase [Marinobacterium aestuariivivens]|uniref:L-threonine 3-dehydrogenase n=1 Tax=Marinobacterium aestuariivivens TaxID=1698799 RepID=A0ABW2A2T5_9GAMM